MNLQLSGHMRNPRFNKDGSATLSFTTAQELSDDETMYVLNAGRRDELGWLLWSPNKFQTDHLPKEQAPEGNKTPSQRLRAVLYILYQQEGAKGDFEAFYNNRMEKLIEVIKAKLDV